MKQNDFSQYGNGDSSFQAAGGEAGIHQLVNDFYDIMGSNAEFKTIYDMHPGDKNTSRDKLARFLCGWLGGPKRFQEKYGSINIPSVHQHLAIAENEKNQWLECMKLAIDKQAFADAFKVYLLEQLSFPAEVIRRRCSHSAK